MSRTFTSGTKYYEFEVMMVEIPNFDKRTNGLYMSKAKNVRASGKCIYCADYRQKKGCKHTLCPYLLERAEMGSVEYREIVSDCLRGITARGFQRRMDSLVRYFDGQMFLSDEHRYNFHFALREIKQRYDTPPVKQIAALYMLTANSQLWNQVQDGVFLNSLDFYKMHIHNLTTDSYAFYLAAKSIYTDEPKIETSELADSRIISNEAFKIMVHGKMVQKYGDEVLKVKFITKQQKRA